MKILWQLTSSNVTIKSSENKLLDNETYMSEFKL